MAIFHYITGNKAKEREQEIRITRSELEKISGSSGSQKREQEDIKSSKKAKKRKYNVEPENWGEQELQKTTEIEAAPSTTNCQF